MPQEDPCYSQKPKKPVEPPSAFTSPTAQKMLQRPQSGVARFFLGSLLLAHFGILFLNNLPWSPAIAFVWPYYAPYVGKLGLAQDWGMYRAPARFDQRIEAEGITPAGRQPISHDMLGWNSSRMLYFIEGLCVRNSPIETSIYLSWVYDQIPTPFRPEWGLTMRREVKQITEPTETNTRLAWRPKEEFFFWSEEE